MREALRRMPPPLLVALGGAVVATLIPFAFMILPVPTGPYGTLWALLNGGEFALQLFAIVGLWWLGARVALAGAIVVLLASIAVPATVLYTVLVWPHDVDTAMNVVELAKSAGVVVLAAGLAITTRRWWSVGALLGVVAANLPRSLLYSAINVSATRLMRISEICELVSAVLLLALGLAACRDATAEEPIDAPPALRRMSLALAAYATVTVAFVISTIATDRIAMVFANACTAAAGTWLALAMLRATRGVSVLPRWLVAASATLTACVAALSMLRIVGLIHRYFGSASHQPAVPPMRITVSPQVLFAVAMGGLLVAIAIAARRRGLDILRTRAMLATGVVAALSLAAIAMFSQVRDVSDLDASDTTLFVVGNGLLVGAWSFAALVVHQAASVLAGDTALPAAKLVSR